MDLGCNRIDFIHWPVIQDAKVFLPFPSRAFLWDVAGAPEAAGRAVAAMGSSSAHSKAHDARSLYVKRPLQRRQGWPLGVRPHVARSWTRDRAAREAPLSCVAQSREVEIAQWWAENAEPSKDRIQPGVDKNRWRSTGACQNNEQKSLTVILGGRDAGPA